MITRFDGPDMVSSRLERFSPPTNFARRYGPVLERAGRVRVLLGAHALALDLADDRARIVRLRATTSDRAALSVTAGTYVLACGGLENARLLLASRDQVATGVGNTHDNVGRYYISHLFGTLGWVEVRSPSSGFMYGFEHDEHGVYCRRRFWITGHAQAEHEIGNAIGHLTRPAIDDPSHGSSLLSATFLAKRYIRVLRGGGSDGRAQVWRAERATRGEPTGASSVAVRRPCRGRRRQQCELATSPVDGFLWCWVLPQSTASR